MELLAADLAKRNRAIEYRVALTLRERITMREFTFDIEYEPDADPVMDLFIEHPDLVTYSLEGCPSAKSVWRIERATGPSAALDRLEDLYLDGEPGALVTTRDATCTIHVLKRTADERIFYLYLDGLSRRDTVHMIARRYLPEGLLFETIRHEERQEWRILMRSDEKVGLLYDTLGATLPAGLSFHVGHLSDAHELRQDAPTMASISAAQRSALETAVEHGYYETPREITLDELSDIVDIPRSTLSYRLRRAEAALAHSYLGQ